MTDDARHVAVAIDRPDAEDRYRVFIDMLRNKAAFPDARCFAGHQGLQPITMGKILPNRVAFSDTLNHASMIAGIDESAI